MNIEKVIEIPFAEIEFSEQLKGTYNYSKIIIVEVLLFFNGLDDKYKPIKYEII